jgi:uncharacterized protein (TIGR02145 family)
MKASTRPFFYSLTFGVGIVFGTGCSVKGDLILDESDTLGTGTVEIRSSAELEEDGFLQDAEGNIYPTVRIGSQVWMAENLRTSVFATGEVIPTGKSRREWKMGCSDPLTCAYKNDYSNPSTHCRLYNFLAVQDERGLCPSGWHVPSDDEWTVLEMGLAVQIDENGARQFFPAGDALKSNSGDSPCWDGTNSSGFSAVPAGQRTFFGLFEMKNYQGAWWSSTPGGLGAWNRELITDYTSMGRCTTYPEYGLSVRCIKD